MTTENKILMQQAKTSLEGKWGISIGVTAIYLIITLFCGMIPILGSIASLIITGPLMLGVYMFFIKISRNQDVELSEMFNGFQNFANALVTYLLMAVFVLLWMLLLIVPGIIKAFAYSMTFMILAEKPETAPMEALRESEKMMKGFKMKLFLLSLRFFGWALLCILTLGIGFLWLMPYMYVSFVKFYDDIKANQNVQDSALTL